MNSADMSSSEERNGYS
jgi:hypothetical protein